jgi:hypothetical protein
MIHIGSDFIRDMAVLPRVLCLKRWSNGRMVDWLIGQMVKWFLTIQQFNDSTINQKLPFNDSTI